MCDSGSSTELAVAIYLVKIRGNVRSRRLRIHHIRMLKQPLLPSRPPKLLAQPRRGAFQLLAPLRVKPLRVNALVSSIEVATL